MPDNTATQYNEVQSFVNDLAVNLENAVQKDFSALKFLLTEFMHNISGTGLFGDGDFANMYARSLIDRGKTLNIGSALLGLAFNLVEQAQEVQHLIERAQESSTNYN